MANYELEDSIDRLFQNSTSTNGTGRYYSQNTRRQGESMFMNIPLNKSEIEIPLFAFSQFLECIKHHPEAEALAAELYSTGHVPRYKTVDRYMRDIIRERYDYHHLVKLEVKCGEDTTLYYGTHGLVLDRRFSPMMMCSWVIHKTVTEEGWRYRLMYPLLRIHPYCYIHQDDGMRKFIVRKMLNCSLIAYRVYTPAVDGELFKKPPVTRNIKVEIDVSPFTLHGIDNPTIQTTNKQLLQVARNHIEEVMQ